MILGRVTGTVTSTVKHPGYEGRKLMSVVPIDDQGRESGPEFLAVDHAQAGVGDTVIVLKEGTGVRQILLGNPKALLPVLETIVGVVDEVQVMEADRG